MDIYKCPKSKKFYKYKFQKREIIPLKLWLPKFYLKFTKSLRYMLSKIYFECRAKFFKLL